MVLSCSCVMDNVRLVIRSWNTFFSFTLVLHVHQKGQRQRGEFSCARKLRGHGTHRHSACLLYPWLFCGFLSSIPLKTEIRRDSIWNPRFAARSDTCKKGVRFCIWFYLESWRTWRDLQRRHLCAVFQSQTCYIILLFGCQPQLQLGMFFS